MAKSLVATYPIKDHPGLAHYIEDAFEAGYGSECYLQTLECKAWRIGFYQRPNFACCGTKEILSFFVQQWSNRIQQWFYGVWSEFTEEDKDAMKRWFGSLVPIHRLDTFAIFPIYREADGYSLLMNSFYSLLLECGSEIVLEFKNPNSGNQLRLVRFPHSDEFKETR